MPHKKYTGRGGPINRPKRYTVKHTVYISPDAAATIEEMATLKKTTIATIERRAIMKDVFIYKSEKKRREELEATEGKIEDV